MRVKLTAIVAASAVAFTVVSLPQATSASATSCDDVKFIFARGSGQSLGAEEYLSFKSSIEEELKRKNSTLKYSFYELGSSSYGEASYPAFNPGVVETIVTKVSAGKAFAFGESIKQGETELKTYLKSVSSICKNTKFVLGGYSQGAMIISDTLPELNANKIVYAATFGDPYLYLPEGKGIIPDACRGKNLSDYRIHAPYCYTSEGILGGKKPYEPENWLGKVGLWCNEKDFMCGALLSFKINLKNPNLGETIQSALEAGHLNYASDGHFTSAAKIITEKLQTVFPKKITLKSSSSSRNRDTVILIDRTGSMDPYIKSYQNEARRLAKETLDAGGRVALYTYGDLNDVKEFNSSLISPQKLADFGTSYDDISYLISKITTNGGGDAPESVLSALMTVMNEQQWRPGATKSIIVLTDDTYLSPDRDGTTLEQVVKRSLEIDPVNIYVINTNSTALSTYTNLAKHTGGKLFSSTGSLSTDYVLNRPSANFPLSSYLGAPGDELTFAIESDGEIIEYSWDLDFDGNFETITDSPIVSHVYNSPVSGYVQTKVKNSTGESSTASALVTITNSLPPKPSILSPNYSLDGSTLRLAYSFGENTALALVSVNGAILGATSESSVEITDFTESATVTITPISDAGQIGEATTLDVNVATEDNTESSGKGNLPQEILTPHSGRR